MLLCRGSLLMLIVGAIAFTDAACGGSSGQTCAQGTERCPCYGNSTCNPGLTCASNTCVNLGGAGGASGSGGGSGGSSRGGTGGTNTAGTGGTSTGGTGGTNAGGSGGTGGASSAGTGGTSAAGAGGTAAGGTGGTGARGGGGGGACTNTSTDPMNCGTCGHVCKNAASVSGCPTGGCCANGACAPFLGPCIVQQSGFTTCSAYCASIGESCAQGACANSVTFVAWDDDNMCQTFYSSISGLSGGPCDATIGWDPAFSHIRCCCTDTH